MNYAVVGAGLSGATVAHQLCERGHRVTVFERRNHVAGNAHTTRDPATGIMLHVYGPHVFHTANSRVKEYVQQFAEWEPFTLRMKTAYNEQIFSGPPINLHTINQFYRKQFSPAEAKQIVHQLYGAAHNFEEAAIAAVGVQLYDAFLCNYTVKQWGVDPIDLPASLAARLPFRFSYDDNKYPSNEWQAIPRHGYTFVVGKMLERVSVLRNATFTRDDASAYDHVFYSGAIDEWFGYQFGRLRYRTVEFERETHEGDYQGCAVVAYPEISVPWTRISEHKHFAPWETHDKTVIFKEYSRECLPHNIPFYPLRLDKDKEQLRRYQELVSGERRVTFMGRLGTYRYLDMDTVIAEALRIAQCVF